MLKDLGTPAKGLVRSAGMPREIRRRRTILVLVILASFTLIVLDARRSAGSPVEPLRHAAAAVFGPLESGATSARQPVDNLRDRFAEVDRLKAENEKLKADNEKLTSDLRTTDYARNRAAELDRLLKVAPKYTVTPARVIGIGERAELQPHSDHRCRNGGRGAAGHDSTQWRRAGGPRRADHRGHRHGAAASATGNSTVGGRLNTTLALGFVSGRGEVGSSAALDYKLVDLKARPKAGDRIVTWGSQRQRAVRARRADRDGDLGDGGAGRARVDRAGEAVRRPEPDRHRRRRDRSAGPQPRGPPSHRRREAEMPALRIVLAAFFLMGVAVTVQISVTAAPRGRRRRL